MTYRQLDIIADSIVPLLLLGLFVLPLLWRVTRPAEVWLRVLVGFALTNLFSRVIRKMELVSGPGLEPGNFPSTHYASALCALTFLVLLRPRLAPLWVLVGALYGWLVVYQNYHTPLELLGSVFAVPLSWAVWRFRRAPRVAAGETVASGPGGNY